jgi:hypothetical protein
VTDSDQSADAGNVDEDPEDDADAGGDGSAGGDDFVPEPVGPLPIEITTPDGRTLEGQYFPSRFPNAPVTILMHWAKGDMHDWDVIGPWLQNRPDELATRLPDDLPSLPEEISYGVVTFNFGGYGASPSGGSRESLLDDATAAALFAANLPGIDPMQISMMGASIGADGAVDACYEFNLQSEVEGRCVGALSLSPGNYITKSYTYDEVAQGLDDEGVPVNCLAAEEDYDSPVLCGQVGGTLGMSVIYSGNNHGMDLLDNPQTPVTPADAAQPIQLIQDFYAAMWSGSQ